MKIGIWWRLEPRAAEALLEWRILCVYIKRGRIIFIQATPIVKINKILYNVSLSILYFILNSPP